jgi:hypothetical protein
MKKIFLLLMFSFYFKISSIKTEPISQKLTVDHINNIWKNTLTIMEKEIPNKNISPDDLEKYINIFLKELFFMDKDFILSQDHKDIFNDKDYNIKYTVQDFNKKNIRNKFSLTSNDTTSILRFFLTIPIVQQSDDLTKPEAIKINIIISFIRNPGQSEKPKLTKVTCCTGGKTTIVYPYK